jgi:hypothetical protein
MPTRAGDYKFNLLVLAEFKPDGTNENSPRRWEPTQKPAGADVVVTDR